MTLMNCRMPRIGAGDGVERDETRLLHYDVTRSIIGGMYAVHTALGVGFVESVYANALSVVLRNAGLHVEREVPFEVVFRGVIVGRCHADMLVESRVVVETKALQRLEVAGVSQLRNYLRASGLKVGLLLNFGSKAEFKRVILTQEFAYPNRPRASAGTPTATPEPE